MAELIAFPRAHEPVTLPEPVIDRALVERLFRLLAAAQAGELVGFGCVTAFVDGTFGHAFDVDSEDAVLVSMLVTASAVLQRRLQDVMVEADDCEDVPNGG